MELFFSFFVLTHTKRKDSAPVIWEIVENMSGTMPHKYMSQQKSVRGIECTLIFKGQRLKDHKLPFIYLSHWRCEGLKTFDELDLLAVHWASCRCSWALEEFAFLQNPSYPSAFVQTLLLFVCFCTLSEPTPQPERSAAAPGSSRLQLTGG